MPVEGRPPDDSDLVRRARDGDTHAFDIVVQEYSEVAFRVAYLITGSAADAEDVAQESFFKAYRSLGRFREGSPLRPWLLRIVANEARNRRRSVARRPQLELDEAAGSVAADDPARSPEAAAVAAEERAILLRCVNGLPDQDRLVIASRYFLELTTEESAGALRCPPGTIKSRLSRALGRLRECMGTEDG
ncbi:MAG: RNA polymerase sigma factor [Candidatus Dormibacteria bacterium]